MKTFTTLLPGITLPRPWATHSGHALSACVALWLLAACLPAAGSTPVPPPALTAPQPAGGVSGLATLGDPKTPELGNTGYDVSRYLLQLAVDPATQEVSGVATLSAQATLDRLARLSLDFSGFDIASVTSAGRDAPFSRADGKLWIDLPAPLAMGTSFSLTVQYAGRAQPFDSVYVPFARLGFNFPGDGTAFVLGEPDGARAWFPCNDHPLDKATFRFELTVPSPAWAAANGRLISRTTTAGSLTTVWEMAQPMATYLATVVVGPYELLEMPAPAGQPQVSVRQVVLPAEAAAARVELATGTEALSWLASRLGPYPFDTFGYASINFPKASLETQTLILLAGNALDSPSIVVHELVHQWFGDSVSLSSWADIWRNEGFATYLEAVWSTRDRPEDLVPILGQWEAALTRAPDGAPLGDPPPGQLFGQDSYIKGAWVAHMLRAEMGDDDFWDGLRTYLARYRGRSAGRAEFQAVLEEVSGRSLERFFAQWLDRAGEPELQVNWVPTAGGAAVQVCQPADRTYTVPLTLALTEAHKAAQQTIPIVGAETRATLQPDFVPATLVADPQQALLARVVVQQVAGIEPCGP